MIKFQLMKRAVSPCRAIVRASQQVCDGGDMPLAAAGGPYSALVKLLSQRRPCSSAWLTECSGQWGGDRSRSVGLHHLDSSSCLACLSNIGWIAQGFTSLLLGSPVVRACARTLPAAARTRLSTASAVIRSWPVLGGLHQQYCRT